MGYRLGPTETNKAGPRPNPNGAKTVLRKEGTENVTTVPTSPKKGFTPLFLDALQPPLRGSYTLIDNDTPHLRLRVSDTGSKSFIMVKRWERGASSAAVRSIGKVGEISLADARTKAREWEALRQRGVDPKTLDVVAEKEAVMTMGAVIESYLTAKTNRGRRKANEDRKDFERDCVPLWKHRPISSIAKRDIENVVDRILARGRNSKWPRKQQAFNVLMKMKALFNWAVKKELVDRSPCRLIEAEELIGKLAPRNRVFSRDELFALPTGCGADALPLWARCIGYYC